MHIRAAAYEKNTEHKQDAHAIVEKKAGIIAVVCDGVSSAKYGAAASKHIVQKITTGSIDAGTAHDAIRNAHIALWEKYSGDAMSTVVCAICTNEFVDIYWVGDSPAYLIRNNTIDLITPLDQDEKEPNVVTQVVGFDPIRVHHRILVPQEGDILLLMSDGIDDNLTEEELLYCSHEKPETAVETIRHLLKMKKAANEGSTYDEFAPDDQSLIVVTYSHSKESK